MTTARLRAIEALMEWQKGDGSCAETLDAITTHVLHEARKTSEGAGDSVDHPAEHRAVHSATRQQSPADAGADPNTAPTNSPSPEPDGRRCPHYWGRHEWRCVHGEGHENAHTFKVLDSEVVGVLDYERMHARAEAAEERVRELERANRDERAVWGATMRQLGWSNDTYSNDDIVMLVERTLARIESAETLESDMRERAASECERESVNAESAGYGHCKPGLTNAARYIRALPLRYEAGKEKA